MLAPWEYSVWFQSFLSTDDGSAASPSTALLASLFSEVTCWNVAVIGTMAGSLFFILLSNSFMQNHPAAVTSAFPSAKVVASESQRRINPRSSCSLPNTCSIGTQPKNRKSVSTQITPNSSATSRTAVGRDLSPLSMSADFPHFGKRVFLRRALLQRHHPSICSKKSCCRIFVLHLARAVVVPHVNKSQP